MFSSKVDNNIELRLIEPRHAEELNTLIEWNLNHIKKWSADESFIENRWLCTIFLNKYFPNLKERRYLDSILPTGITAFN